MVSLRVTAINLHILQLPLKGWRGVLESQNPKCQDLPKFQFGGGGFWNYWGDRGFWKVKTQGSKICLNFNFTYVKTNEKVPAGDTAISLHTPASYTVLHEKLKSGEGVYSWYVQNQSP